MRTTEPGINVGDPEGTSPVPGDLVRPQAGAEVYRLWDGSRERGGAARAIAWVTRLEESLAWDGWTLIRMEEGTAP